MIKLPWRGSRCGNGVTSREPPGGRCGSAWPPDPNSKQDPSSSPRFPMLRWARTPSGPSPRTRSSSPESTGASSRDSLGAREIYTRRECQLEDGSG